MGEKVGDYIGPDEEYSFEKNKKLIELRKEVEFNPNLDLKDILDNKELKYYKKTIHKEYGEIPEIRETILEFKEIATQMSKKDPLYNYYVLVDGESMTVTIQRDKRPMPILKYPIDALNTTLNARHSINSGLYNFYQGNYSAGAIETLKGTGNLFELLTLGTGSYAGDQYKKISAGAIVHGTPEEVAKMQEIYKSSAKGIVDLAVATYTSGLLPTNTGGKIKFQPEYAYVTSTVGALEISKPTFSVIAKEIAGGMKSGSVYAIVGKNLLENTERDNLKDVESSSKTPETKKGGRLGKEETRNQLKNDIGNTLIEDNWKITGGGGIEKEEYLKSLIEGSKKGSNYVDITAKKMINGSEVTIRINTVDTYKKTGLLTNREAKAADLINIKITREGLNNPELITIPKGTGTGNLNEILNEIKKRY